MINSTSYSLCFLILSILSSGCKKDVEINPKMSAMTYCADLYTSVSTDTNYIPHKKNNTWTYCKSDDSFSTSVYVDTTKAGKIYFEYAVNYGQTAHNPIGCICDFYKIFIDSSGNYFSLRNEYTYLTDTLKIIDLNAVNGDTIFKSKISPHYVFLVNKNDTFESITNCYHIKIAFPEYNRSVEYYYKKGIGIVNYNGSKLINAHLF